MNFATPAEQRAAHAAIEAERKERLQKAAPELLAALKALLADYIADVPGAAYCFRSSPEAARAAIAEAEGR